MKKAGRYLKRMAETALPPAIIQKVFSKSARYAKRASGRSLSSSNSRDLVRGKIVEFIGPSGVGKSYIAARLLTAVGDHYRSRREKTRLHDHLVTSSFPHWKVLTSKIQKLGRGNFTDYQRVKLTRYFSEVMAKDAEIRALLNEHGFLLDQGLFNNFPEELMDLDDSEFMAALASRVIVLVVPDRIETVLERRGRRIEQTGHFVTLQSGLSDAEEREQIAQGVMRFEEIASRAEKFGCPILRLKAEDSVEKNISSFFDFERSCSGY